MLIFQNINFQKRIQDIRNLVRNRSSSHWALRSVSSQRIKNSETASSIKAGRRVGGSEASPSNRRRPGPLISHPRLWPLIFWMIWPNKWRWARLTNHLSRWLIVIYRKTLWMYIKIKEARQLKKLVHEKLEINSKIHKLQMADVKKWHPRTRWGQVDLSWHPNWIWTCKNLVRRLSQKNRMKRIKRKNR